MKERPIVFCGELIPGLLDGSVTQTRRVISYLPRIPLDLTHLGGSMWRADGLDDEVQPSLEFRCPFGEIGDRLWVKEVWGVRGWMSDPAPMAGDHPEGLRLCVEYRADEESGHSYYPDDANYGRIRALVRSYEDETRWRSPRFMPRWAARIILELVPPPPQPRRVQDISVEDAKASGFLPGLNGLEHWRRRCYGNALLAYEAFWNDLNARRGHPWDANEWTWPLAFKRVED